MTGIPFFCRRANLLFRACFGTLAQIWSRARSGVNDFREGLIRLHVPLADHLAESVLLVAEDHGLDELNALRVIELLRFYLGANDDQRYPLSGRLREAARERLA
jgi:hypothetical protein